MSKGIVKNFQLQYPLKRKRVGNRGQGPEIISDLLCDFSVMVRGTFNPDAHPLDISDRYKVELDGIFYKGEEISAVVDYFDGRGEIEDAALRAFAKIIEHEQREGQRHE